jgi:hypothetical protein
MPSADQVPINNSHSTMRGGNWVVLIAGSTGSDGGGLELNTLRVVVVPKDYNDNRK